MQLESKKRQRRFLLNSTDENLHQFDKNTTMEVEDIFSVNKLELWKHTGFSDKPVTDDLYDLYAKRNTVDVSNSLDKNVLNSAMEKIQNASLELVQLTHLTTLLKGNEYLTVQPCYKSDHDFNLPAIQSINLLKLNISKAKQHLRIGFLNANSTLSNRGSVSSSLLMLKKHWSLSFVDKKSNKVVPVGSRQFDPLRDRIAVDCSVAPESQALVHLDISGSVVQLSREEQERPHITLRLAVLFNNGKGDPTIAASVCAWDLHCETSQNSSLSSGSVAEEQVDAVRRHCERRQHESQCRTIFGRMREECVDSANIWCGVSIPQQSCGGERISVTQAFMQEKIVRSLAVRSLGADRLQVSLSQSLSLEVTLEEQRVSVGEDSVSADTESQWLHHALSCCIVTAQRALLPDVPTGQPQRSRSVGLLHTHLEDIWIAKNATAGLAEVQGATIASSRPSKGVSVGEGVGERGAPGQASLPTLTKPVLRPVLRLLRAKILKQRVRASLIVAQNEWSNWGCWASHQPVLSSSGSVADGAALSEHWKFSIQPFSAGRDSEITVSSSEGNLARVGGGAPVGFPVSDVVVDTVEQLHRVVQRRLLGSLVVGAVERALTAATPGVAMHLVAPTTCLLRSEGSGALVAQVDVAVRSSSDSSGGSPGSESLRSPWFNVEVDFSLPSREKQLAFSEVLSFMGVNSSSGSSSSSNGNANGGLPGISASRGSHSVTVQWTSDVNKQADAIIDKLLNVI